MSAKKDWGGALVVTGVCSLISLPRQLPDTEVPPLMNRLILWRALKTLYSRDDVDWFKWRTHWVIKKDQWNKEIARFSMLKLCHSEHDASMNHSVRRSSLHGALPTNVGHFLDVAYFESSCSFLSSRLVVRYSCKIHLTWMTMFWIKVAGDWAVHFFISRMNWSHD